LNDDIELLSLVSCYDQTSDRWDSIASQNENDPRLEPLAETCAQLEYRITATPAFTSAGLAAKQRIIEQTCLAGEGGNPPAGNVEDLVDAILALDAERIKAKQRT